MRIRSTQLENDKIYYDSFIIGIDGSGMPFPIDTSLLVSAATMRAPMVHSGWQSYFGEHCRWEVFTQDMSFWVDNLTFPSIDDCANWINNNAPGAPSGTLRNTLVIRPYDIVDYSMPMITKLYGYNRLLHSLKGAMQYQAKPQLAPGTRSRTIYQSDWSVLLNANESDNWIHACYNELLFTNISPLHTDPNIKDTVWLSQNYKGMYGLLRAGDPIEFSSNQSSNGYRKCYSVNASSIIEAPTGTYRVSKPEICIFRYNTAPPWEWRGPSSVAIGNVAIRDYDLSMLMVYPISRSYNGDTLLSLLVKPWGVDRLVLNYFDNSRFKLDMISRTGNKILNIQEVNDITFNFHKDQAILTIPTWNPTKQRAKATGEYLHRNASFRLRDTETGRVSLESEGRLVPLVRTRYARAHRWMVVSK